MICSRCNSAYPDTADCCPICGQETPRRISAAERLVPLVIRVLWGLVLVMTVIGEFLIITAAHYATDLRWGILTAIFYAYEQYPGLAAVDVSFGLLLAAAPVLATMGLYHLLKENKKGVYLMIAAEAIALLWCLSYFSAVGAVTGFTSPVRDFCLWQAGIYAALALGPSVWLVRTDRFL